MAVLLSSVFDEGKGESEGKHNLFRRAVNFSSEPKLERAATEVALMCCRVGSSHIADPKSLSERTGF